MSGPAEAHVVTELSAPGTGIRVVRRCADLAELLAVAHAGLAQAVVLASDLDHLDAETVLQCRACGTAVLVLVRPGDSTRTQWLRALGVEAFDSWEVEGSRLVAMVHQSVHAGRLSQPSDSLLPLAGSRHPGEIATSRHPSGQMVAVWGPAGAPGRTTVATTVAHELAALGYSTTIIDADTYGPSIAQVLGLLDDAAGLSAAVRLALNGLLDVDSLARLAPMVEPRLRVVTGIPHAARWPELRAAGLEGVWRASRGLAQWTVVDCGFNLETDEELSFDTAAPRRNGATLSALAAADVVLAVGACDPLGLQRFIRGLHELRTAVVLTAPPVVVVNRLRTTAVGPDPRATVLTALQRYAQVAAASVIPDDPEACDRVLLSGRSLTEVAPESLARHALAGIAGDLVRVQGDVPVTIPKLRRTRLLRRKSAGG